MGNYSPPAAVGELVSLLHQEEDALGISLLVLELQTQKAISEEPLEEMPEEVWIKKPETILEKTTKLIKIIIGGGAIGVRTLWAKTKKTTQKNIIPFIQNTVHKLSKTSSTFQKTPFRKPTPPKTISQEQTKQESWREGFFSSLGEGLKYIGLVIKKYTRLIIGDIKKLKITDLRDKTSRRYLAIFMICLLLLASSITFMIVRQNQKRLINKYESILTEAETKEGAALQALIIGDRKKAKTLLNEAQKLAQGLLEVIYKPEQVLLLLGKIEEDLDKVEGIVKLTPTLLTDFSTLEQNTQTSNLVFDGIKFYSIATPTNKIYSHNPKENKNEIIGEGEIGSKLKFLVNIEGKILAYSEAPQLWRLEEGKLTKVTLPIGTEWQKGMDAAHYLGNLYLLTEEGQIYKYWKTYSGFSKPFQYISGLKNPQAIAISTFVYVLHKDGELTKILKLLPSLHSSMCFIKMGN